MHANLPRMSRPRTGITLLEVLISIGILAVGLGSVVALIPAGRAHAGRAVILDRAAGLAANVMADMATFGILRRETLTAYPPGNTIVCVDPSLVRVVTAPPRGRGGAVALPLTSVRGLRTSMRVRWQWPSAFDAQDCIVESVDEASNVVRVTLPSSAPTLPTVGDPVWFAPSFASPAFTKPQGLYAASFNVAAYDSAVHLQTAMQGRDDLVIAVDSATDDPPLNPPQGVVRPFEGRLSAIACLQPPAANKSLHTLSVVTFHARDPALPTLTGTLTSGTLVVPNWEASALGSRRVPEVIKPGTAVFADNGFHRVTAARIKPITPVTQSVSGTYAAWMTFSTGTAIPNSASAKLLIFFPDSVGLVERPVSAESPGPFTQ